MTMRAPSRAARSAMASPMPRLAPVMKSTLSRSEDMGVGFTILLRLQVVPAETLPFEGVVGQSLNQLVVVVVDFSEVALHAAADLAGEDLEYFSLPRRLLGADPLHRAVHAR